VVTVSPRLPSPVRLVFSDLLSFGRNCLAPDPFYIRPTFRLTCPSPGRVAAHFVRRSGGWSLVLTFLRVPSWLSDLPTALAVTTDGLVLRTPPDLFFYSVTPPARLMFSSGVGPPSRTTREKRLLPTFFSRGSFPWSPTRTLGATCDHRVVFLGALVRESASFFFSPLS